MNKITKCLRRHWVSLLRSVSKKLTCLPKLNHPTLETIRNRVSLPWASVILLIGVCLLFGLYPTKPSKDQVLRHLDNITFLIDADKSTGTGTLFSRRDEKGDLVHFIWTAGHVIKSLKVGPNENMEVTFKDLKAIKIDLVAGARLDKTSFKAKVLKYSEIPPGGDDLALLELEDRNVFKESDSTVFAGTDLVAPGTLLYHVGCMHGEAGYNSVSEGMLANNGRIIYGKVFDQTSTTVFPGSSGGGVFNERGEYVGMVTLMRQANMNFITPMRRIWYWAKENNVEWALNKKIYMPREYVRHNLYKDSGLDTEFEQFRYFMTMRWKKGLDIQLDMSKQIKKLQEDLEATKKQLGITNSIVAPPKTNNAGSFLLRLFGPPDDHDDDEDED